MLSRILPLALLLCVAGCIFATGYAADVNGVKPRIIDGTNVPASQYPMVGIVSDSTGDFICSGTLIAPRFVLTAAHCAVDGNTGDVNIGQTGGRFMVGGVTYRSAHVYANPTYHGDRSQEMEGAVDLCIFELTEDVPNVTPAPLYRMVPTVGTSLTLVGYGEQGTGSKGTDGTLPKSGTVNVGHTPIDIVTNTFIKWNFNKVPPPNQESNTAPGDSGGPQFITVNGVLTLASVTSGGTNAKAAFGDLSYNTRVDIATQWIDTITGGTSVSGNNAPVIGSTSVSPTPVLSGIPVTFSVSAFDPDGDPINYHWIFGDGTDDVNGSASETHTFPSDGDYLVQLLVTDGRGGSVEKDFNITAGAGGNSIVIPAMVVRKHFTLNFTSPERSSLDFTLSNGALIFSDKNSYLDTYDGAMVNVYIGMKKIDSLVMAGTKGFGVGALTFTYRVGTVRYNVRGNPALLSLLAPFGATNITTNGLITVPLRIELNGSRYGGNAVFSYSSRQDKAATGR